jgi:ATP synthase protein I
MTKPDSPWKAMIFTGVIGVDLAVCTIGGFWLGRYVDQQFQTAPFFLLVGLLLGLSIAIYSIYTLVRSVFGEK